MDNYMKPLKQLISYQVENPGGAILDVEQVISLERSIEADGTSLYTLMQRAGHSVSEYILTEVSPKQNIVIFCGSGNNGGDGWVIADDLCVSGLSVSLVTPCPAKSLQTEPARSAALAAVEHNHKTLEILVMPTAEKLHEILRVADLVVDAILGTGFKAGHVKEPYKTWVDCINEARTEGDMSIISVDVPSGLSAQTGEKSNATVSADATITMLAYKPGLLQQNGKTCCGKLYLADIA